MNWNEPKRGRIFATRDKAVQFKDILKDKASNIKISPTLAGRLHGKTLCVTTKLKGTFTVWYIANSMGAALEISQSPEYSDNALVQRNNGLWEILDKA